MQNTVGCNSFLLNTEGKAELPKFEYKSCT